jgi:hypothetical protein
MRRLGLGLLAASASLFTTGVAAGDRSDIKTVIERQVAGLRSADPQRLLAAFPLAFAIIVPALYFPILMMLMGLMLRGVAFEYRHVKDARKGLWAFFWGSTLAAFAQGIMLGMFVDGFAVEGRNFAGGSFGPADRCRSQSWPRRLSVPFM